MRNFEALKILLKNELEEAKTRQTWKNQVKGNPSGFMKGILCALKHVNALSSIHDMSPKRISPPRGEIILGLILESHRTGATIVCFKDATLSEVISKAEYFNLSIPRPLMFREVLPNTVQEVIFETQD